MKTKIKVMIVILTICIAISNVVYGTDLLNQISPEQPANNSLLNPAKGLLGYIQALGVVLSVIMLIAIGIKYMMGSVEERAEYKKTLMPYFIGSIVLFSASTFAQVIYKFIKSL